MPLDSICEIAYDAHVPEEMVRSIIYDFDLFKVTKKEFYSVRVGFELADKETRSSAASKSANARWDKYKKERELNMGSDADIDTAAMRTHNSPNTDVSKTDAKIKGNKIKGNKIEDTDASPVPEGGNDELFSGEQQAEISVKDFVGIWNEKIEESNSLIPKIEYASLSEKQRQKVKVRIREMARLGPPLEVLSETMGKACASRFCNGATESTFILQFGWFIKNEDNWKNIYQGKYDNRTTNNGSREGRQGRLHVTATSAKDYEEDF